MDVYMKNLGCSFTSTVMSLEFTYLQIHFNASGYSLKFHVLELPKLPYIAVGLLTLNLGTLS